MGANRPVCCTQRAESELGELRENKERAEGELEGQLGGGLERALSATYALAKIKCPAFWLISSYFILSWGIIKCMTYFSL